MGETNKHNLIIILNCIVSIHTLYSNLLKYRFSCSFQHIFHSKSHMVNFLKIWLRNLSMLILFIQFRRERYA